jgi:hypothetical protein
VYVPDNLFLRAVVADGAAHLHDAARDGRVADGLQLPDLFNELFLRHHPLAVAHQIDENFLDERLNAQHLPVPAEFKTPFVELKFVE